MTDHLGYFKSWTTSFPVGRMIYKIQDPYTVLSAGTDFLVLKRNLDGLVIKLFRNTPESYEYTATPKV
ncbi:MAG TPA: hypothetical protein VE954_15485 [Oligoflexus sp.]|uniref:hypothetical protein n=1 Tax=Oligoflexus sp. TaxID=1971216 RepID=UPI002D3A2722|nr:hypothetical protein [Oligoflexus sp.]HYX34506.1 hypothetical protein [Oligoflexus sp.]